MSHSDTQMIYLASKSPRRQELLNQIGIQFTVLDVPSQDADNADMVDETVLANETAADYVNRLSRNKADCAWQFLIAQDIAKYPVLTADTTVVLDNRILGKPQNRKEAREMMERLSGKTHQVLTSVAIRSVDFFSQVLQTSSVTFAELSSDNIDAYILTSEPYDKAGGYGIQGRAGKFIKHIEGSYSGIMGLPLYETSELLRKAGIAVP